VQRFKHETFWGREKENLIYPIGLANLILHGIDDPNIWHGNALTGDEVYGGLFQGAPTQFDVILTNPPFGGKESVSAQTNFDYRTSATQVLFMQHFIRSLRHGGAAAWSSTRACSSAPTKRRSSRPSGNSPTSATCGACSRCRAGSSAPPARA
jgi:type I restriction-modification system DNA methylase subunit